MTKRLKIILTVIIILVLMAVAIWYSSGSNINEGKSVVLQSESLVSEAQDKQFSQAKDILNVLSLLKTINLNLDFFDNIAFKSLYDFSVQLPTSEIGKNNPFAP